LSSNFEILHQKVQSSTVMIQKPDESRFQMIDLILFSNVSHFGLPFKT
jgi:hypothetical protein